MDVELSYVEVLGIAEQIERDAAGFYRRAAAFAGDPQAADIYRELAQMETDHSQIFGALKDSAAGSAPAGGHIITNAAGESLPLMAAMFVEGARQDLAEHFTGREINEAIYDHAIAFEKDTIVFYLQIKTALADGDQRKKIDRILLDELGHVITLTCKLASHRRPTQEA